jgi:putative tryptophan/tyrosine transport system substrate-binding protein
VRRNAKHGIASDDPDPVALFYQVGTDYIGPLLDGAKLTDLPIQQPTRLELVLNLKTAKTLGLTIPSEFRLRVTEVIQ